jgi:hypothetical protein
MTQSHNEFFIEKEQLPVEVTLVTGEELYGVLFVQPTWRQPSIEFDALVLLNLPDAYFPIQLPNGTSRLVSKRHAVSLRGRGINEDDNGSEEMGDPARVVVKCTNGDAFQGTLMVTRVTSNSRVLDYLNHSTEEFILLHEGQGTVLINRRHIVLVHDESDGAA